MATKGIRLGNPQDVRRQAVERATAQLARYGQIERQIESLENDLNDGVKALQDDAQSKTKPLQAERAELKKDLEQFARLYRSDLAEGKTIPLPTGDLQWKTGKASLEIVDESLAKRSIRRLGKAKEFLKTSFSIRKTELVKNPAIARQLDGIVFRDGGEFFYIKPHETPVDTSATGKQAA